MRLILAFSESNTIRSDDAYAKDRIRSARLKLNGINPAVITAYVYENDQLCYDRIVLLISVRI
jgi:hypothetical protein